MVSSSPQGEAPLGARVTAPLALSKINLTLLAHVAGDREVLCTASEAGEAAATLLQSHAGPYGLVHLQPGVAILGLYPHNNQPAILGAFVRSLAGAKSVIHGLASSPSAITVVISALKKNKTVQQLFEHFHFSSFESPKEFFAAQPPPEEILQKVVATYQEKVIKVYLIVPQADLDLWGMSIASRDILEGFAYALSELAELGLTVPFLVALPGLGINEFLVSFSTARDPSAGDQGAEVRGILQKHLPESRPVRLTPVAGIFLHGPHFGDRYGIAHTLVEALEKAHVTLLALSCTISSISLIIRQRELTPALLILGNTFEAPVAGPSKPPN
ncbi:MAG: hypothetical protein Q8M54_12340 [Desulfobaccales bacterium]|nr:hypothetical protein [Desulfobaccales bacterium]